MKGDKIIMGYIKKGLGVVLVVLFCLCNFTYIPVLGYAKNIDSKIIKSKEAKYENLRADHNGDGGIINSKFKIMKKSPEILSMLLIEDKVEGNRHGLKTPYNLNPETGEEIILHDILEDIPEYKKAIIKYLKSESIVGIEESDIEENKFYLNGDNLIILVEKNRETEEFSIPFAKLK